MPDLSFLSQDDLEVIVSAFPGYAWFSLAGTWAAIQRVRRPEVEGAVFRISLLSGLLGAALGFVSERETAFFLALLFGGFAFLVPGVAAWAAGFLALLWKVNGSVGPVVLVSAGLLGGGIGAVLHPASVIAIGMSLFAVSVMDGLSMFLVLFAIGAALAAFFLAVHVAGVNVLRALKRR